MKTPVQQGQSLNFDQQKRLLAAELAKHTYRPEHHNDVIELAEQWLKFIEGPVKPTIELVKTHPPGIA